MPAYANSLYRHNVSHISDFLKFSGSVEFVDGTLEAFENDSSVEVCVRAHGYGFTVNMSTQSGPGEFVERGWAGGGGRGIVKGR